MGVYSSFFASDEPLININTDVRSIKINQGEEGSFEVNYKVYGGFDEQTTFSIEGLPSDTSISYKPSSS